MARTVTGRLGNKHRVDCLVGSFYRMQGEIFFSCKQTTNFFFKKNNPVCIPAFFQGPYTNPAETKRDMRLHELQVFKTNRIKIVTKRKSWSSSHFQFLTCRRLFDTFARPLSFSHLSSTQIPQILMWNHSISYREMFFR